MSVQRVDGALKTLGQSIGNADRQARSAENLIIGTQAVLGESARREIELLRQGLQQSRVVRQDDRFDLKLMAGLTAAVAVVVLIAGVWLGRNVGVSTRQNQIQAAQIYATVRRDVLTNILREAKAKGDVGAIRYVRAHLRQ